MLSNKVIIVKDLTLKQIQEKLKSFGYPGYCGQQIFNWLYQKGITDIDKMSNIAQKDRSALKKILIFNNLDLITKEKSIDGTEKFLFGLADNSAIESVIIPDTDRNTLCLSSQVGCKFKCAFCLSGQLGFKRNLMPNEIINQYLQVSNYIKPKNITNLVFMGVGEPLDNFENLIQTIKIFLEPKGLNISRRRITISTCGLAKQIEELAQLKLGIKLSVSLHSPNDITREKIMPVNKHYNLETLAKALKLFNKNSDYPITFEYTLIHGLNTASIDAENIYKLFKGLNYKLNLIPLNQTQKGFLPPTREEIEKFQYELDKRSIFSTLRKPRGQDINAACGQLSAKFNTKP